MGRNKGKKISVELSKACEFLDRSDLKEIAQKTGYSRAYVSMVKNRESYNEEIEKHLFHLCRERMLQKLEKIRDLYDEI